MTTPPLQSSGFLQSGRLFEHTMWNEPASGEGVRPLPAAVRAALTDLLPTLQPEFIPSAAQRAYTARCLKNRPTPPLSTFDTLIGLDLQFQSVHGTTKIFPDEAIVCIFEPVRTEALGKAQDLRRGVAAAFVDVLAAQTEFGHWVIQQQGQRGCSAAGEAMLKKDSGFPIDLSALKMSNCRGILSVSEHLKREKIQHTVSQIGKGDLTKLKELEREGGPALISVDGEEFGGHVLIVDHVGSTRTLLRDPYHGWQCLVENGALAACISRSPVIQLASI